MGTKLDSKNYIEHLLQYLSYLQINLSTDHLDEIMKDIPKNEFKKFHNYSEVHKFAKLEINLFNNIMSPLLERLGINYFEEFILLGGKVVGSISYFKRVENQLL